MLFRSEEFHLKDFSDCGVINSSSGGELAIAVEFDANGAMSGFINPDVSGTAVERDNLAVRRDVSQVADAAKIVDGDAAARGDFAGDELVEARRKWRSFAAHRHVAVSEIGNHGEASGRGDARRIAQLNRESLFLRARKMRHRLAVRSDGVGRIFSAETRENFSIPRAEIAIEFAEFAQT